MSKRPAEGKSTTRLILASTLDLAGKSLLLVDASLPASSMHKFLSYTNIKELSKWLVGRNKWQMRIVVIDEKGMNLLPAGPAPPSASELFSTDRMMMLFDQISDQLDYIVVNLPPILRLADAPP